MKWSHVWRSSLGICALDLTHPKFTHQWVTHTQHWEEIAAATGDQFGDRCCSRVSPQTWYWRWRKVLIIHSPIPADTFVELILCRKREKSKCTKKQRYRLRDIFPNSLFTIENVTWAGYYSQRATPAIHPRSFSVKFLRFPHRPHTPGLIRILQHEWLQDGLRNAFEEERIHEEKLLRERGSEVSKALKELWPKGVSPGLAFSWS